MSSEIQTLSLEERMKIQNSKPKMPAKPGRAEVHRKRANKNRPREMSSKIPPRSGPLRSGSKKPVDPRFESLYGEFNEREFKKNYDFVEEMKQKDVLALKKLSKKERDPERQQQIRSVLKRMTDRERELQRVRALKAKVAQEKSHVAEALAQGKTAKFKTKAESKLSDLVSKFGELKEKGKLVKYMKKKTRSKRSKKSEEPEFMN